MLRYLVILLDDMSTSYCHYENKKDKRKLISIEDLKAGILFGMKENLMIQFVYPDYDLPQEYKEVIHNIDHTNITPFGCKEQSDVTIFNEWDSFLEATLNKSSTYVIRTKLKDFFKYCVYVKEKLENVLRLNIAFTDLETFTDDDKNSYIQCLKALSEKVEYLFTNQHFVQLNILTDRIMLEKMNNCGAGDTTITLAPNGFFYVCPAFYYSDEDDTIGSLYKGLCIKNMQLYKLGHAPLCRNCDAYQCKRCIWLNHKMTLEVNTPSHEQCVISHLERNSSRDLLMNLRKYGIFMPKIEIDEIKYLDPFEK